MPRKVGTVHDHLLPVVANLQVGEVWECDCTALYQVVPGGPAGQERGWLPIERDPGAVDFIQEEKVEEEAEPTEEEKAKAASEGE